MFANYEAAFRSLLKTVLVDVLKEALPQFPKQVEQGPSIHAGPIRLLLRPPEAAKALGISGRTLWGLTRSGSIPCVRIKRLVRYDVAALQKWITLPVADRMQEDESTQPLKSRRTHKVRNTISRGLRKAAPTPAASAGKVARRNSSRSVPVAKPVKPEPQADVSPAHQPRSAQEFFSSRLGVDIEQLPRLTHGELMRIAGVDVVTLHGWIYLGHDLPVAAFEKLEAYFAAVVRGPLTLS